METTPGKEKTMAGRADEIVGRIEKDGRTAMVVLAEGGCRPLRLPWHAEHWSRFDWGHGDTVGANEFAFAVLAEVVDDGEAMYRYEAFCKERVAFAAALEPWRMTTQEVLDWCAAGRGEEDQT